MSELVDSIKSQISDRGAMGNLDPEEGHARIDSLCEQVVWAAANKDADAFEAAQLVAILLEQEKYEGWVRWYA